MPSKCYPKILNSIAKRNNIDGHDSSIQHLSLVDEFRIVKVDVIVLDAAIADRIATTLIEEYFTDQPGIVGLSEVHIFRAQKF